MLALWVNIAICGSLKIFSSYHKKYDIASKFIGRIVCAISSPDYSGFWKCSLKCLHVFLCFHLLISWFLYLLTPGLHVYISSPLLFFFIKFVYTKEMRTSQLTWSHLFTLFLEFSLKKVIKFSNVIINEWSKQVRYGRPCSWLFCDQVLVKNKNQLKQSISEQCLYSCQ